MATTADQHFFDNIDTEEKAYWLGFIAADGYLHKNGRCVSIEIKNSDRDHLSRFKDLVNAKEYYRERVRKGTVTYSYRVVVHGKLFSDSLKRLGLDNDKSKSLTCGIFEHIPDSLLNHFIRGYFDGDGCISNPTNGGCKYSIASTESFNLRLKSTLDKRLGFDHYLVVHRSYSALEGSGMFRSKIFRDFLYNGSSVYLDRKHKLFYSIKDRSTSKYRYVSFNNKGRWVVRYMVDRVNYFKSFRTEQEAVDVALSKGLDIYGEKPYPRHKGQFGIRDNGKLQEKEE